MEINSSTQPSGYRSETFLIHEILESKRNDSPNHEEHPVLREEDTQQWIQDLKKDQEDVNAHNFNSILEHNICPKLQNLKKIRPSVSEEKQRELLAEFVRFYGNILSYSRDYNHFYCIYHYIDSQDTEDIFNISKEVLTETQHGQFLEILENCHKQETNGNGDRYDITTTSHREEDELFSSNLNSIFTGNSVTYANFSSQGINDSGRHVLTQGDERESEMINHFSNIIFENTSCQCPGNSRCTRGCRKYGLSRSQVRCRKGKNRNTPLFHCMRYTNAAIMGTLHIFLERYCPNSPFDYNLCLESSGNRNTLCDQSLVFPSALCGLNLDGQDRYKVIGNRKVRSRCRQWLRHNEQLLSPQISIGKEESLRNIPLFQEIEMPEYPEDLPEGSIIVSKSNSIHGHIEVKTNKRECGVKGEDICFCSDFCDSRKEGYKWPFKPQIVFQWNPEFIYYFENGEELDINLQ